MSNLNKTVKEIEFCGVEYIVTFDMRSIAAYKKMTSKGYVQAIPDLAKLDDEAVVNFLGATMRKKETPKEPIGAEVYDLDLAGLLFSFNAIVIDIITASMPQGSPGKKKKK